MQEREREKVLKKEIFVCSLECICDKLIDVLSVCGWRDGENGEERERERRNSWEKKREGIVGRKRGKKKGKRCKIRLIWKRHSQRNDFPTGIISFSFLPPLSSFSLLSLLIFFQKNSLRRERERWNLEGNDLIYGQNARKRRRKDEDEN